MFKFASDVNVDQTTEIARMEKMLGRTHAPTSQLPLNHLKESAMAIRSHSPSLSLAARMLSSRAACAALDHIVRRCGADAGRQHVDRRRRVPIRASVSTPGLLDAAEAVWNLRVSRRRRRRRSSSASPTPTWRSPATTPSRATTTASRSGTSRIRASPTLKTAYFCPASQSDVSVYKNLLFVSGEGIDRPARLRRRRA